MLSHAPPAVVQWVHANAAKYGLAFPLGNENWHVETVGARSGTAAKGDRVLDLASRRVDAAFANQPDQPVNEMVGTVQLAPTTGNPADVYTQAVAPYRVAPDATNLADWLSAREDYADNPSLLAEVERQLTDVAQSRTMEAKAQEQQIKTDIFRSIVNGGKVKDYDQSALQVLGGEGVKSMLEFETAWNKESDETDPRDLLQALHDDRGGVAQRWGRTLSTMRRNRQRPTKGVHRQGRPCSARRWIGR